MTEEEEIWDYFWERFEEKYAFGKVFLHRVFEKATEIWKEVSPFPLGNDVSLVTIEGGVFKGTMGSFVFTAAIGEIVLDMLRNLLPPILDKTLDEIVEKAKNTTLVELKSELSKYMILPKRCPKCDYENPPTAKYCMECGYNFEVEE